MRSHELSRRADVAERYGEYRDEVADAFQQGETSARHEAVTECIRSVTEYYRQLSPVPEECRYSWNSFRFQYRSEAESGGNVSAEESERAKKVPMVPPDLQPYVFSALVDGGKKDIALDLVLLGRITCLGGGESLERLLAITLPDDHGYLEGAAFDPSWETLEGAKKAPCVQLDYEASISFFEYLRLLTDRVTSPKVTSFAFKYGYLGFLPDHLDRFPLVQPWRLANRLCAVHREDRIFPFVDRLPTGDHYRIFIDCLRSSEEYFISFPVKYAYKFRFPDRAKIDLLMRSHPGDLAYGAEAFSADEHPYLFDRLVGSKPGMESLVQNLWRFDLDPDVMAEAIFDSQYFTREHFECMRWFGDEAPSIEPIFSRKTADRFLSLDPVYFLKNFDFFQDVDLRELERRVKHEFIGLCNIDREQDFDSRRRLGFFSLVERRLGFSEALDATRRCGLPASVAAMWVEREAGSVAAASADPDRVPETVRKVYEGFMLASVPGEDNDSEFHAAGRAIAALMRPTEGRSYLGCLAFHEWEQLILKTRVGEYAVLDGMQAVRSAEEMKEFGRKLLAGGRKDAIDPNAHVFSSYGLSFVRELAAGGSVKPLAFLFRAAVKDAGPLAEGGRFTKTDLAMLLKAYPKGADDAVRVAMEAVKRKDVFDANAPADQDSEDVFAILLNPAIPSPEKHEPGMLNAGFAAEARRARRLFRLSPCECQAIIDLGRGSVLTRDERGRIKDDDALLDALLEAAKARKDLHIDEFVIKCISDGRDALGARAMLAYMAPVRVSRHDAVHFMPNLLGLFRSSGLSREAFTENILLQVAKDGASYESGTSYAELAAIAQGMKGADFSGGKGSVQAVLAARRADLPELDSVLSLLDEKGPFSSWRVLRKAYGLFDLAKKVEVLDRLKDEPSPRMRKYVAKLAFHPNIATDRVLQFWGDTGAFLDIEDEHAPGALSQAKKPSNYLTVAHLAWEGKDLRDALVGRDNEERSAIDRLQTLPPHSATFELNEHPESDASLPGNLYRMLVAALGRRREGVPGQAKNPKRLFVELGSALKEHGMDNVFSVVDLARSASSLDELRARSAEAYEAVRRRVFHPEFGMAEPDTGKQVFRARIGWKSDPDMVIAGNDTASCMPFGSGKNNVYMFNPNCVQLVVERRTPDGEWRTAAQSVVTINQEVGRPAKTLLENFRSADAVIGDLVDPSDFARPRYIACDNIEVAKNAEGDRVAMIAEVYRRFWKEYLQRHAGSLGISADKVVAGLGYTPAGLGFREETNDTVPLVPMSYSDNLGAKHFVIDVNPDGARPGRSAETRESSALRPILPTDIYAIAHLESKAFKGTGLGYGIHQVQNNLLGIAIANQLFGRPNLSFVSQVPGKPASAYLVAYEGETRGERMVYVDDMAAESKGHPAAGRVLLAFVEAYLAAYRSQAAYPPVLADMRDSTSYQLVTNQLERLSRRAGLKTRLVPLSQSRNGGDVMHRAAILIASSEEELDRQEARVREMA